MMLSIKNKRDKMNTIEKIINLIKEDKPIAENLFLFYEFSKDVALWTGLEQDNEDYSNIKWLFITEQQNHNLIGLNVLDDSIWAIDDEGNFHNACETLQDLPYEILRLECAFTDHGTVEDYFEKYKDEGYQETLQRYEQWCKNHGIELDKNKIYHDDNGQLFTKSFSKKNE